MADLSEINATLPTKIVGANNAGMETDFVNASTNGDLFNRDVINTAGVFGAISVTTTAIEAKVGGTLLANRKSLSITPTNGVIYWGYSSAVTTATGTPIFSASTFSFGVGISVFLIAAQTTDVRITEGS